MKMEKLPMCRLCTVENVNMYVVVNKNLQEIYEKLTDIPFVTGDNRPMLACFFCCTKLKQCWRLQRKCLEAEKLFAQMLNEDYEIKPQVNQDQLEFGGYIISPTVHVSLSDEFQTESDFIKEELPDVCEGQDDDNQTEPEHEFQEYLDSYSDHKDIPPPLESQDIPPHHSESENLPAQDFEAEGGQHSETDSENDIPLMKLKTEVEEERKVSEMKRKANDTKNNTQPDYRKGNKKRLRLSARRKTRTCPTKLKINQTLTQDRVLPQEVTESNEAQNKVFDENEIVGYDQYNDNIDLSKLT